MCGRILAYSFSNEQLIEMPGRHKHGTEVLKLAALCGRVSHNWLISSIGRDAHNEGDVMASMGVDNGNIACQVLLSLGSGYHEMFKSENEMLQQRILTWCFLKR